MIAFYIEFMELKKKNNCSWEDLRGSKRHFAGTDVMPKSSQRELMC